MNIINNRVYSEVSRFTIEHALKRERHNYEDSSGTGLFFKCPVSQTSDELALQFNVKQVPTIVFYRNNEECGRLVKPTEDELLKKLDELK